MPTIVLALGGALLPVLPLLWVVIAATKSPEELFTTFSGWPSFNGGFTGNLSALNDYGDGRFWQWMLNSLIYAGGGAFLTVVVSAAAGYALAKYRFPGSG